MWQGIVPFTGRFSHCSNHYFCPSLLRYPFPRQRLVRSSPSKMSMSLAVLKMKKPSRTQDRLATGAGLDIPVQEALAGWDLPGVFHIQTSRNKPQDRQAVASVAHQSRHGTPTADDPSSPCGRSNHKTRKMLHRSSQLNALRRVR